MMSTPAVLQSQITMLICHVKLNNYLQLIGNTHVYHAHGYKTTSGDCHEMRIDVDLVDIKFKS